MCVLACGSNRGYTECYCQHWAEGLHSSEWTLGRARRLSVALCAPPLQVQQQTLCSTLWFHLFVLTRLITYKIAPVKRGIGWKQTKAASWGISSPAAVTWWCWQMFISITSFWTLMCKKINPLTDETIKMPAVIAERFSSNLYCIYSHTFLLSIGWTEAMPRESVKLLPHNEQRFSYCTCAIALFRWSCLRTLLFRCTNMRNVGKSNQEATIMTCYVHKHTLCTADVPQTSFKST